jgi:hypothetical protein
MATTKEEGDTTNTVEPNGSSTEEKPKVSHDLEDGGKPSQPADIESPRAGVDQNPPMTFKRIMAIFSLGCLLAAAQIPIYLIGGALCMNFLDLS